MNMKKVEIERDRKRGVLGLVSWSGGGSSILLRVRDMSFGVM